MSGSEADRVTGCSGWSWSYEIRQGPSRWTQRWTVWLHTPAGTPILLRHFRTLRAASRQGRRWLTDAPVIALHVRRHTEEIP